MGFAVWGIEHGQVLVTAFAGLCFFVAWFFGAISFFQAWAARLHKRKNQQG